MKALTQLFLELDRTNSTKNKVTILRDYFIKQHPSDNAWTIFILTGKKIPKRIKTSDMKVWVQTFTDTPLWLFEECYAMVGDLAETITLLINDSHRTQLETHTKSLTAWMEECIVPLAQKTELEQEAIVTNIWRSLPANETFIFNKLSSGGFRVGVQAKLVFRALGEAYALDPNLLATRAIGNWAPSEKFFTQLVADAAQDQNTFRPLPFCLAYPVELDESTATPLQLGDISDWQIEPKWDGIRGQLIHSDEEDFLWSRGEEIITHSFPELIEAVQSHSDRFIIDGEIIAWKDGQPLPFSQTQKRIGRKVVGNKIRQDVPVAFLAYDCLRLNDRDLREQSMTTRRRCLEKLVMSIDDPRIMLSPLIEKDTWKALSLEIENSREKKIEGYMLKKKNAPYHVGRVKGDWWKWKVAPLTLDAVMIYAQAGHGRRAGLYTDYTFAVWKDDQLVPIAKAYSGLSDKEIVSLNKWIKKHTKEKFGPVRQVKAEQVFEIAFEGIQRSPRHKSGLSLRFPRIKRWRSDKPAAEADSIETLITLLQE